MAASPFDAPLYKRPRACTASAVQAPSCVHSSSCVHWSGVHWSVHCLHCTSTLVRALPLLDCTANVPTFKVYCANVPFNFMRTGYNLSVCLASVLNFMRTGYKLSVCPIFVYITPHHCMHFQMKENLRIPVSLSSVMELHWSFIDTSPTCTHRSRAHPFILEWCDGGRDGAGIGG